MRDDDQEYGAVETPVCPETRTAQQIAANRRHFPEFAAFVDHLSRLAGGKVRVSFLSDDATQTRMGRPGNPGVVCHPIRQTGKVRRA